ncbi:hypothetical protein Droror1_Dr00027373 [Drosera rotundifolia]
MLHFELGVKDGVVTVVPDEGVVDEDVDKCHVQASVMWPALWGKPLYTDTMAEGMGRLNFARVCCRIDVIKLFVDEFMIKLKNSVHKGLGESAVAGAAMTMGERNNIVVLLSNNEDNTTSPGYRSSSRRRTTGGNSKSSSGKGKSGSGSDGVYMNALGDCPLGFKNVMRTRTFGMNGSFRWVSR